MLVAVDLHVHEDSASADSRTPASDMALAAVSKMADFALLGFVGHDSRPTVDTDDVLTLTGIEHEIQRYPRRIHVIEYPKIDFRILAHPRLSWPRNTRSHALEFINDHPGINAVERYSSGRLQYDGHLPVIELAGSDAHSPLMIGSSFNAVTTDMVSADSIIESIRRRNYQLNNHTPGILTRTVVKIEKAGTLLWKDPDAATSVGKDQIVQTF